MLSLGINHVGKDQKHLWMKAGTKLPNWSHMARTAHPSSLVDSKYFDRETDSNADVRITYEFRSSLHADKSKHHAECLSQQIFCPKSPGQRLHDGSTHHTYMYLIYSGKNMDKTKRNIFWRLLHPYKTIHIQGLNCWLQKLEVKYEPSVV